MTALIFFLFGIVFGSFLNVCIHRFPRGESIVRPGSHCPECSTPIRWHQNIPLWSYIFLRGRCRQCGISIPLRYFIVELLSGLIWVTFWHLYGLSALSFIGILLFMVLLGVTVTDIETGYIPDKFTLPAMTAGLVLSALFPEVHRQGIWYEGLLHSTAGLLTGGGILLATGLLGNVIFKKESMGGGDIKLFAMLGAFLGFKQALLLFLLSPIAALPMALYVKFFQRLETIPYGPFIAVTGGALFLTGDAAWNYFFGF